MDFGDRSLKNGFRGTILEIRLGAMDFGDRSLKFTLTLDLGERSLKSGGHGFRGSILEIYVP